VSSSSFVVLLQRRGDDNLLSSLSFFDGVQAEKATAIYYHCFLFVLEKKETMTMCYHLLL
jgi:hypothetical protein